MFSPQKYVAAITAMSPPRTSRSRFMLFFSARCRRDAVMKQIIASQIIVECVAAGWPETGLDMILNTGLPSNVTAEPLLSDRGTII